MAKKQKNVTNKGIIPVIIGSSVGLILVCVAVGMIFKIIFSDLPEDNDYNGEVIISKDVDSEPEKNFGYDKEGWPNFLPAPVPKFEYGLVRRDESLEKSTEIWTLLLYKVEDKAFAKYKTDLKNSGWNISESRNGNYLEAEHSSGLSMQLSLIEKNGVLTIRQ